MIIYPKPYSIYLRETAALGMRTVRPSPKMLFELRTSAKHFTSLQNPLVDDWLGVKLRPKSSTTRSRLTLKLVQTCSNLIS